MEKTFYIVTQKTYIGHNPFAKQDFEPGMDIRIICESFEDANTYIDREIELNMKCCDQQCGEGIITCKVDRPEFFKGHEVDVYFTDHKESKKWMWLFSIYERSLFDPNEKWEIPEELEKIESIDLSHCMTPEEMHECLIASIRESCKEREKVQLNQ